MPGEQELRRASDAYLARLGKLRELEMLKRDLTPGTSHQLRVTREVEALTNELLAVAKRETQLAVQVAQSQPTVRPISIIPPRDMPLILTEWRDAERLLEKETPGTAAWESVRADVEGLREEYKRAFDAQRDKG